MSEPSDRPSESRVAGGCVVFLIDESQSLETRISGGTKSKAESIATALNSLLNQLATFDLDVAIVGYRGDGRSGADVGCRWDGPLAGNRWVPAAQLAANPLTIEERVRRVPVPGNLGMVQEETIRFPIWYVPTLNGVVFPVMGYGYCQHLLSAWIASAPRRKPPLVIGFATDWPPQKTQPAVDRVLKASSPWGPPLILHVHLGGASNARPVLFPSTDLHLPSVGARDLFNGSSVLPDFMLESLRRSQVAVNSGARGLIYCATMADMIRLLSLVKAYAQFEPQQAVMPQAATEALQAPPDVLPAASDAPQAPSDVLQMPLVSPAPSEVLQSPAAGSPAAQTPSESIALAALLLDRSVADPSNERSRKTWTRLQDHANDLLGQVVKRGRERVEVAVVSYGADPMGRLDLRTTLAGPLEGRTFASGVELEAGSLRIAEVTEQIPNGIGGLISFTRKKPIFLDIEAAAATAVTPALEAVGRLVADWRTRHPGSMCPPVVLHLTRAKLDPEEASAALDGLYRTGAVLYHLVVTESPHRSLAYPNTPENIADPVLQKLWQWTSLLLGSDRLAVEKRTVAADSRGMVINGRFDLLLDGILGTMEHSMDRQEHG